MQLLSSKHRIPTVVSRPDSSSSASCWTVSKFNQTLMTQCVEDDKVTVMPVSNGSETGYVIIDTRGGGETRKVYLHGISPDSFETPENKASPISFIVLDQHEKSKKKPSKKTTPDMEDALQAFYQHQNNEQTVLHRYVTGGDPRKKTCVFFVKGTGCRVGNGDMLSQTAKVTKGHSYEIKGMGPIEGLFRYKIGRRAKKLRDLYEGLQDGTDTVFCSFSRGWAVVQDALLHLKKKKGQIRVFSDDPVAGMGLKAKYTRIAAVIDEIVRVIVLHDSRKTFKPSGEKRAVADSDETKDTIEYVPGYHSDAIRSRYGEYKECLQEFGSWLRIKKLREWGIGVSEMPPITFKRGSKKEGTPENYTLQHGDQTGEALFTKPFTRRCVPEDQNLMSIEELFALFSDLKERLKQLEAGQHRKKYGISDKIISGGFSDRRDLKDYRKGRYGASGFFCTPIEEEIFQQNFPNVHLQVFGAIDEPAPVSVEAIEGELQKMRRALEYYKSFCEYLKKKEILQKTVKIQDISTIAKKIAKLKPPFKPDESVKKLTHRRGCQAWRNLRKAPWWKRWWWSLFKKCNGEELSRLGEKAKNALANMADLPKVQQKKRVELLQAEFESQTITPLMFGKLVQQLESCPPQKSGGGGFFRGQSRRSSRIPLLSPHNPIAIPVE